MKKWMMVMLCVFLLSGCGSAQEENTKQTEATEETVVSDIDMETEEKELLVWEEKELAIPELEQDYEIWFMTDSHITLCDESESAEVAEYAAQRTPGFANEMGVSSEQIFSQFIDEANEQSPDMILFGGDILDFPSDANMAFLKAELDRLEVPYVLTLGNHDWTFPWEYMTEEGSAKYRPVFDDSMYGNFTDTESLTVLSAMGNSYANVIELNDMVILSVDDSSNQVASEALEVVENAYGMEKPIILLQHVPFSTEKLIEEAKNVWANPVTLGMQIHGGIAPNDASFKLWELTHDEESLIKLVLAGHVHFQYEEELSDNTMQIISDAAFKGSVTKLLISGEDKGHQYFCDKFVLTVDEKQYNLTDIEPEISSVSELLPITNNHLYILGRVDENNNALMIYDFEKDEFVFSEQGSTVCWVQDDYESVRYLKENVVYDLNGNVIYDAGESNLISMIEYVEKDFKVSITDLNHENLQEVWINE